MINESKLPTQFREAVRKAGGDIIQLQDPEIFALRFPGGVVTVFDARPPSSGPDNRPCDDLPGEDMSKLGFAR